MPVSESTTSPWKDSDSSTKSIDSLVDQLINIIRAEADNFGRFLDLLNGTKPCSVRTNLSSSQLEESSINRPDSFALAPRALMHQGEFLEQKRLAVASLLADQLSLRHDELCVAALIPLIEKSRAARLRSVQTELLELYQQIQQAKTKNQLLIQRSLFLIRKTMKFLTGPP